LSSCRQSRGVQVGEVEEPAPGVHPGIREEFVSRSGR
jgi:hypothetical protein